MKRRRPAPSGHILRLVSGNLEALLYLWEVSSIQWQSGEDVVIGIDGCAWDLEVQAGDVLPLIQRWQADRVQVYPDRQPYTIGRVRDGQMTAFDLTMTAGIARWSHGGLELVVDGVAVSHEQVSRSDWERLCDLWQSARRGRLDVGPVVPMHLSG